MPNVRYSSRFEPYQQVVCLNEINYEQKFKKLFKYQTFRASPFISGDNNVVKWFVCLFNLFYRDVLNRATRLILGKQSYDHVTPSLIDLHWLSSRQVCPTTVITIFM